jgi:hypothetical protein
MRNIRKEAQMAKAHVKGTPSRAEVRDEVDDIWGEALEELFGIDRPSAVSSAAPAPRQVAAKVKPADTPKKPSRKRST